MNHYNNYRPMLKKNKQQYQSQNRKFQSQSGIFRSYQKPKALNNYSFNQENKLRQTFSTVSSFKHIRKRKPLYTDFIKLKLLGRGRYGNVYLVCHRITGFISAIKIIEKQRLKNDEKLISQLIQQIKIQSFMKNSNIIQLYTFFSDQKNIYLLMELGSHGQLYQIMQKREKFNQQTVGFIAKELLIGLSYIHELGIIHRDLKPQNIVLIHGVPKICDFGWSVYCPTNFRSTLCGTPLYLSPQILIGQTYNQKIDTWALGNLTHELFTGQNPFKIIKRQDLQKIITDNFQMKNGSQMIRDFIQWSLSKNPKKRPDSKKLINHPFIRKYQQLQTCEDICF